MLEGAFTIVLGGIEHQLPPLTLGRLKQICLALPSVTAGATEVGFDAEIEILLAGLQGNDPGLTREALLQWPMTRPEMLAAANAILRAAGFGSQKDKQAGEAGAGKASA